MIFVSEAVKFLSEKVSESMKSHQYVYAIYGIHFLICSVVNLSEGIRNFIKEVYNCFKLIIS